MKGSAGRIKLSSYDDLMMGSDMEQPEGNGVVEVSLEELHEFPKHPFKVIEDEHMDELAESIRDKGVLVPGIVRKREAGGYELVAGHRRKRASQLVGKLTMPVVVKEYTDEEAVIVMVDTNIQREELLCSERAFAYKMKFEAVKRQGMRTDLTCCQVGIKSVAANETISIRTIQRYISLTNLNTAMLEMVDGGKLSFMAGVELSYLKPENQEMLYQYMLEKKVVPSPEEAEYLHKCDKEGELNDSVLALLFDKAKPKKIKVVLAPDKLEQFFSSKYSKKEIEEVIYGLLEEWKGKTKGA